MLNNAARPQYEVGWMKGDLRQLIDLRDVMVENFAPGCSIDGFS